MFLKVCKQTVHLSHVRTTQKVKGVLTWNLQHNYFHMQARILTNFQFCISVPLTMKIIENRFWKGQRPWWHNQNEWLCRRSHRKNSLKKMLWEISQNSQENICARVSFLIKLGTADLQLQWKQDSSAGIFLLTLWNL